MSDMDLRERGDMVRTVIYDFIVDFFKTNGYAPSIQEIGDAAGLKSKASVYYHLEILEMLGKIHVEKGKSRAIKIMGYIFVKVGG